MSFILNSRFIIVFLLYRTITLDFAIPEPMLAPSVTKHYDILLDLIFTRIFTYFRCRPSRISHLQCNF